MGRDNGDPGFGYMNSLIPPPNDKQAYTHKFHPLPGAWAHEQLNGTGKTTLSRNESSSTSSSRTEIQRAIADEEAVHRYWEKWQGVTPGEPVYADPREMQNTLLPAAKYGTEGRGYG